MPTSDDAPSEPSAPASTHRLAFSRLVVKRLYGIEHNVAIDALCDGINILYGPNASGKTTLARAVEHVIWPDGETGPTANGHPVVSAAFHLGGAAWRVDVDGSRCRYERDHQPTGRPAFPSPAHRDRYHLYLPDLLAATDGDADFARRILQEAQGGVDVRGAAGDLGWTDIPTSNKGKTARTLDTRQTKLREAKAKQNALRDRERDLSRLRDRLEEAQQAATRAQVLQQAIAVAEARAAHDEAKTALGSFPDAMEHVRDDDVDVLERLKDTLRSAEQTIEDNTERVEDAEATLRESILPDEGLSAGEKQTLQATVDRLKEQHTELQRITERLSGKEDEEHEAWERLSVGTDRERAAQIRLPALSEVEQHARKANGLRARKDALEHVAGRLADDRDPPSVQALRDGLRHLSRWLQVPDDQADDEAEPDPGDAAGDGSPGLSLAAAGLGIAVAILGGVLLVTTGSLVLGIALIVIGLALVGLEVARRGSGDDDAAAPSEGQADRSVFEAEFQRTGLEPPSAWTREPVEAAADDLLERLQDAAVAAAKAEEKKQLEREQAEADEQHAALHAERSELAEQIGLVPDVSSHALPWLVGRLRAWQTAYDAMTGLRGQRKAAQEKQAEILEQLNAQLAAYSLDGVSTAEAAAGAVAELEAARDTFEAAVRQRDEAQREIERAASEKKTAREDIEALYARLDLGAGDEDGLRSLVSQHEEYKAAKEKERERRTVLKTQQQALETKDAYEESLEEASKETLAEQRQKAKAQARREEELREEITEIEHQVKKAREGGTVEQLRAEYEATRDKLARRRHKDYQAAVGHVLAEFVRDQTQTESLPQVFRRARELFAKVTHHRYKLALDFDNETFRAVDTVRDRGFALDALSSGTKVQLLLAVRVAFVEQQEQGPRLPLVLDETLANSDGEKARAMIDAIGALCQATGRQVFYLTAQEDEVRKWMQQMADRDIPCEVKTLTGDTPTGDQPDVRRRGDGGAVPVPATTVDTEALRGRSHDALKEALSVPDWTPRDPVAALHLWYLVEDPDALLDLMARGVKTWGQLRFQYQRGGPSVTPLPDADDRRVQALAKALQSWTDAWEVGRGQPVDRAALQASGAVTENFIDGVSDLAADLNGDAEALLHELRERSDERAKRFHSSKADKLEAYCEANGYIDPRATHDREAMWQHVVADVSDEMEAGVLTRERMQALFERIRVPQ